MAPRLLHASPISLWNTASWMGSLKHKYPTPTKPPGHPEDPLPSVPPYFIALSRSGLKPAKNVLQLIEPCPFLLKENTMLLSEKDIVLFL